MVKVTQAACEYVRIMLEEASKTANVVARILQRKRGYSMHLDKLRSSDEPLIYRGRPALVMDIAVSQSLVHRVLDVEAISGGSTLILR